MFMDGTTTYSCDTLVAGLVLQSTPIDWWCLYWIHGDMDPSIYTSVESAALSHYPNTGRSYWVQSSQVRNPIMGMLFWLEIQTFGSSNDFQIGTQLFHKIRLILTILMVVHMSGLVDY